jgi:hypothetical protein
MSPIKASEAQLFYANLLHRLTLFGFALLLIAMGFGRRSDTCSASTLITALKTFHIQNI